MIAPFGELVRLSRSQPVLILQISVAKNWLLPARASAQHYSADHNEAGIAAAKLSFHRSDYGFRESSGSLGMFTRPLAFRRAAPCIRRE
jgi:hypothetical protein